MKKLECEHMFEMRVFNVFDNTVFLSKICNLCHIEYEYKVELDKLFEKIEELDNDPNIFFHGVLQND